MKLKKMEISDRVVQRLTEYLSILKEVRKYEDGINSIELSKIMDTTSAQVRKDLSTFGEFGVRGKGYDIDKLIEIIEDILGINKVNDLIVVGYGKMGEMITSNSKVMGKGFRIVGVFDNDPQKIDQEISGNLKIQNVDEVEDFIKNSSNKVETAILSVVKGQAQTAAEKLVKNGIKAILNMTTYKLELPKNVVVVNMDISAKLQELNFWRINLEENGEEQ
ncbi:putative redox-sensing transcriptional repressor Rex [Leptotrichia sp. oral taxon 215 str. W9775]|mgnify:FL=1|jgi:redox-sensing transcriptional repressor rex|uniref:redox-sensing transcriptional repressor Rex n=1 Tax=Leptotrichia sp. oral taxon 215 TaxID=712359 RepID=UPI0003ADC4A6|nr:redox-sensing transcriptional repressor Rex [Leptotrichia sp. oral taxon 215]ERK65441.1 putative redox-sensing transcriptional repressor Rex [Leptotrichia sp. oral taxon 215 str. W9775]MBF1337521.1 redox-sensing transcriptional repressor Rex [Leptotrichia sp.]